MRLTRLSRWKTPGRKLEEQTQPAQTVDGYKMGVVDDGDQHFARAMDEEGFLDEVAFALEVAPDA